MRLSALSRGCRCVAHRCKKSFLCFFHKNANLPFLFLEGLLFSSGTFFILLNLINSEIKGSFSDGLDKAAIGI